MAFLFDVYSMGIVEKPCCLENVVPLLFDCLENDMKKGGKNSIKHKGQVFSLTQELYLIGVIFLILTFFLSLFQRNLDQLEALSKKLKAKTLRTEAPSQSIAATRYFSVYSGRNRCDS